MQVKPFLFVNPRDEKFIKLTPTTLFYHTHTDDPDVSRLSVRSAKPTSGRSYFEVEIIELVGEVGIGFAPLFYLEKDRLGMTDYSAGYYSDGNTFLQYGGQPLSCIYRPWKNGDIIGCGVFGTTFFVTRNGVFEGSIHNSFTPVGHPRITVDGVPGTKLKINTDLTTTRYPLPNLKKDLGRNIRLPVEILNLIFLQVIVGLSGPFLDSQISRLLFVSTEWCSVFKRPTSANLWKYYLSTYPRERVAVSNGVEATDDIEDWYGCISSFKSGVRKRLPVVPEKPIIRKWCNLREADYITTCPKYCIEDPLLRADFVKRNQCPLCRKFIFNATTYTSWNARVNFGEKYLDPETNIVSTKPDWKIVAVTSCTEREIGYEMEDGTKGILDGWSEWSLHFKTKF